MTPSRSLVVALALPLVFVVGCDKLKGNASGAASSSAALSSATPPPVASTAAAPPASATVVASAAPAPEAKKEPFAPPGKCVDPTYDSVHTHELHWGVRPPRTLVDLDDDNETETVVQNKNFVKTYFNVYVKRGKCGHFVGDVYADQLDRGPEVSHGLHDIIASTYGTCGKCGCKGSTVRYAFDGKTYKATQGGSKAPETEAMIACSKEAVVAVQDPPEK